MATQCIRYRSGYKYQLEGDYVVAIPIKPDTAVGNDYIQLSAEGELKLRNSYAWDGPSGPTVDTLNFMRGSLIHDALYQLMREKLLDGRKYRDAADRLLQQMCIEDGMSSTRAWWVYQAVRFGGGPAADPANSKPIHRAPFGCE
jgi:hypothetical protein